MTARAERLAQAEHLVVGALTLLTVARAHLEPGGGGVEDNAAHAAQVGVGDIARLVTEIRVARVKRAMTS